MSSSTRIDYLLIANNLGKSLFNQEPPKNIAKDFEKFWVENEKLLTGETRFILSKYKSVVAIEFFYRVMSLGPSKELTRFLKSFIIISETSYLFREHMIKRDKSPLCFWGLKLLASSLKSFYRFFQGLILYIEVYVSRNL